MEQQGVEVVAAMREWLRGEFFTNKVVAHDMTAEAVVRVRASMKADWAAEGLFHLEEAAGTLGDPNQQHHYDGLRREFQEQQNAE